MEQARRRVVAVGKGADVVAWAVRLPQDRADNAFARIADRRSHMLPGSHAANGCARNVERK